MVPHLADDADRSELCEGPSPKFSVTSVVGPCTSPSGQACHTAAAQNQVLCSPPVYPQGSALRQTVVVESEGT